MQVTRTLNRANEIKCPLGICVYKKGTSWVVLVVKNPPTNAGDAGDMGLIPGLGRSPGYGYGNPLQYSCLENLRYLCTPYSQQHYSQQPKGRNNHERVHGQRKGRNKMYSTQTMEYYSALKRKGILTPATTQVDLDDIMLSEISQSRKTNTV